MMLKGIRSSKGSALQRTTNSPLSTAIVDHKCHQLRQRTSQANGRAASTSFELQVPNGLASLGGLAIAGQSMMAVRRAVICVFEEGVLFDAKAKPRINSRVLHVTREEA
jgi:hypothetical protein